MILTPTILVATYEFFCQVPPFSRWRMPEADEIEFHVVRAMKQAAFADCGVGTTGAFCMRFSARRHRHIQTLLMTMAHEMIHLHQKVHGLESRNNDHNENFWKCAKYLCATYGWDIGIF